MGGNRPVANTKGMAKRRPILPFSRPQRQLGTEQSGDGPVQLPWRDFRYRGLISGSLTALRTRRPTIPRSRRLYHNMMTSEMHMQVRRGGGGQVVWVWWGCENV